MPHVLVWDIETVPDLRGFAAANGLGGKSEDEIREAMVRRRSRAAWERGVSDAVRMCALSFQSGAPLRAMQ
jgi:hypothetical protein